MHSFFRTRLLALLMAVCLSTSAVAFAASAEGPYTPGTYTATSFGMLGDVVVTMTFDDASITAVEAIGDKETPGLGTPALVDIPEKILAAQSTQVDVLAGATVTSEAVLEAANACISQAKGQAADTDTTPGNLNADILVIGAGAGGLAAAAAAAEAGASVIVLEANGRPGGAAIISAGNINYLGEEILTALGRNDKAAEAYLSYTPEDFPQAWHDSLATLQAEVTEYLKGSEPIAFDSISRVMVDHYLKGYGKDMDGVEATLNFDYVKEGVEAHDYLFQWLVEGGLTITAPVAAHYVTPTRGGTELIEVMERYALDAGAEIICDMRAVELIVDNAGKVVGAHAVRPNGEEFTYTANQAVILATGGFSANLDMVLEYQNMALGVSENSFSSNPDTNAGDGIVMAAAIGADLMDMQFMGFIQRGYHNKANTWEVRDVNAAKQLAVNANAKRFTDDSAFALVKPASNQPDAVCFMIGDKAMYDALEEKTPGFTADLESRGILFMANTLEEAAALANLDAVTLAETVGNFNAMVEAEVDNDFGRSTFNGQMTEAPFILVKTQALNHLTFGGLVTDNETRVLDTQGNAIPGLYAVGDVIGGYEGAAHQTGACLTIIMHFGMVAADVAIAEN